MSRLYISAILLFATTSLHAEAPADKVTSAKVDRMLKAEVMTSATSPLAPTVDDETYLRRVFLDIVGELPTPEDVIAFSLDPDKNKRENIVDTLLDDEDYGKNWARYWRDVMLYRRSEDRALIASTPLTDYLTEAFNENKPWDELAASFITSEGNVRENGATALYMAQMGQPEETVAEISRIFMGIQIQCAQCHDHPTDRWKRQQFHELAAFLPRVAVRPDRSSDQVSYIVYAQDFQPRANGRTNNNNRFRGTLEHRMPDLEHPEEPGKLMQPKFFVTGRTMSNGTKDDARRGNLARWVTSSENPWFAGAIVNRMWSELIGRGFYEPVDDMGPDRECIAPKTMNYIASGFVESGHDMKWLMKTILLTDAYQRETRPLEETDESPYCASVAQRLRGDQLFSNLSQTLGFAERPAGRGRSGPYGRGGPRLLFNQAFGYDPSERRDEVSGSIQQALAMMNSSVINGPVNARYGTNLAKLVREIDSDEDVVFELYLKALAREPSDKELRTCLDYVKEVGRRDEAFEDLLWSLVNSTEFLHRR